MIGKPTETKELAWNLSQGLVMEISQLLVQANTYYTKAEYDKAFSIMRAIKLRFIQNLSQEERIRLTRKEIEFLKAKKTRSVSKMGWNYEEYNIAIMDLLEKYGFLISKKSDATKIS